MSSSSAWPDNMKSKAVRKQEWLDELRRQQALVAELESRGVETGDAVNVVHYRLKSVAELAAMTPEWITEHFGFCNDIARHFTRAKAALGRGKFR